jgi:hypothetical protein
MQNQKNEFIKIHQSLKLNAAQKAANAILNLIKPNVII